MATGGDDGNIERKSISDLVTCPLCLEYYQKPTLLPCGHSVCRSCLHIYVDKTLNKGSFLCPICRNLIALPENGVDGYAHSFFIVRLQDEYNKVQVSQSCDPCRDDCTATTAATKCVECCEYLCEECTKAHRKARLSKAHHVITLDGETRTDLEGKVSHITRIKCHSHEDEVVRYFCVPCRQLICRDCKALSHADHKAVTFQEAIKGKLKGLQSGVQTLRNRSQALSALAGELSENISTLEADKNSLIESIVGKREELFRSITRASENAIDQVETLMSREIKIQKNELGRVDSLISQVKSHLSYATVLLSKGNDVEILDSYALINRRTAHLSTESVSVPLPQALSLQSVMDSSVTHSMENHFQLRCKLESPREIQAIQTIWSPENYRITGLTMSGDALLVCAHGKLYRVDGKRWTNMNETYDVKGKTYDVCSENDTFVMSERIGCNEVQLVVGNIITTIHTRITLPFVTAYPTVACGRPVNGQPTYFVTQWKAAVHHIDFEGNVLRTYGQGELANPQDIAESAQGELIVADSDLDDVFIFNSDGNVKRRLRFHNNLSKAQMLLPLGVGVDENVITTRSRRR